MGSICHINANPTTWIAFPTEKKLKPEFGSESLMMVRYGSFDDYPEGVCDMEIYMRTSIYDKLIKGIYTVSPESKFKHELIILDERKQIVPKLGSVCY